MRRLIAPLALFLALFALAPAAKAAPAQVQGQVTVSGLCPGVTLLTTDQGYVPVAVDKFGNVCPPATVTDLGSLITSTAAAAGTTTTATQTNLNARGIVVAINMATVTSCSLVVSLQEGDGGSGVFASVLSSAAITSAGYSTLTFYPGAAATANVSAPSPLVKFWRLQEVRTGASCAVTGTVDAIELP